MTNRKIEDLTDELRSCVGYRATELRLAVKPCLRALVPSDELAGASPHGAGAIIRSRIEAAIERIEGERVLWGRAYRAEIIRRCLRLELGLDSDAKAFKRRADVLVLLGQGYLPDYWARPRNTQERDLLRVLARELCEPSEVAA